MCSLTPSSCSRGLSGRERVLVESLTGGDGKNLLPVEVMHRVAGVA